MIDHRRPSFFLVDVTLSLSVSRQRHAVDRRRRCGNQTLAELKIGKGMASSKMSKTNPVPVDVGDHTCQQLSVRKLCGPADLVNRFTLSLFTALGGLCDAADPNAPKQCRQQPRVKCRDQGDTMLNEVHSQPLRVLRHQSKMKQSYFFLDHQPLSQCFFWWNDPSEN